MPDTREQLLLDDNQVMASLAIDRERLAWLVSTRQLLPIFIRGARRFLMADLQALLRTYQVVQNRN
jgi:hypothetical protein